MRFLGLIFKDAILECGWIIMSEKILMKVIGHNGQIELFNTKIRIKRKGFVASMTQRLKDDREIPI